MNREYRLQLLGIFQVERQGEPVQGFVSRKAVACLAYMALQEQPVSRSYLGNLFWEDKPEARGRANLSRVLHNLSEILPHCLHADRHTIKFRRSSALWVDTTAFKALIEQDQIGAYAQAADLYRDDLMAGFFLGDCADFEAWLVTERERWRQQVVQVYQKLITHYIDHRDFHQSLEFASRILEIDSWLEEAHRQKMVALAHLGQRSAALAQYEICRQVLYEELGVEPGEETETLYTRIRDGNLNSTETFGPQQNPPAQIVAHRLNTRDPKRDLTYTPGLTVAEAPLHNLPSSPTPLIGRQTELTEIGDLLADPACRLVTLVGLGGIGKTRLSIEATRQALSQFSAGACFVSLASTDSAEDIIPRIATAFDPKAYPTGQAAVDFLPQLRQRDPALLLVLDNFEQLLPDGCTAIEKLLTQTGRLKLIVTSRQALNIRWEWRYALDGLAYPSGITPNSSKSYSAVEMFLQRVRQTRRESLSEAEVQATAQICRLVGGIPLGIELAAAQASRLTCATVAEAMAYNLDGLVVSLRDLPGPAAQSASLVRGVVGESLA